MTTDVRRKVWRANAVRVRSLLGLWAASAVAAIVVVALVLPGRLFAIPRTQPLVWLLVVVFYPLLSVYPQELVFRAFPFQRYAPLFGSGTASWRRARWRSGSACSCSPWASASCFFHGAVR